MCTFECAIAALRRADAQEQEVEELAQLASSLKEEYDVLRNSFETVRSFAPSVQIVDAVIHIAVGFLSLPASPAAEDELYKPLQQL